MAWPLIAWVALILLNLWITPNFGRVEIRDGRAFGSLIDIVQNGAPVLLLAVGMTLVIASGGIDLSVGSVMALSGATAALLLTEAHQHVIVCVGAALLVGAIVGAWNGVLVCHVGLQPIIATLVTLVAGRGLAQTLTNDQKIRFEDASFEWLANGALIGVPVPAVITLVVALAALAALELTAFGLYIEAIGCNPRAARLCGLRLHTIRICAYMACGVAAAIAGLITAADIKEADVANAGQYLELDAILAVVIGGTPLLGGKPRLIGALIGAGFMQTLTITLQMHGVATAHALILKAALALLVCYVQTPGFSAFFAKRAGTATEGAA